MASANLVRQATYEFPGDFRVFAPADPSNGTGYLQTADYLESLCALNATGPNTGAIRATNGGLWVQLDSLLNGKLTAQGASILQQTDITTTNGPCTVHGSGAINLSSTASPITLQTLGLQSINFNSGFGITSTVTTGDYNVTVTSGNITQTASANISFILSGAGDFTARTTKGRVSLVGTSGKSDAIALTAGDSASGIMLSAGTLGISGNSAGPITLNANAAASSFTLTTTGDQQDLAFNLAGSTASRLVGTSAGSGIDAIYQNASAGGITQTSVTRLTQTVSAGPIIITSTSASSSFTHNMTADGQSLSFQLLSPNSVSGFNGNLNIRSSGNTVTALNLAAQYGGFTSSNLLGHFLTSSAGPFRIISSGGTTGCQITSAVTSDSQDFLIAMTDATASKQSRLVLSSQCPPNDAIRLASSVGGITLNAASILNGIVTAGPFRFSSTMPVASTSGGCSLIENSTASGQDFTIALMGAGTGPGTSRLLLSSAGTGPDAINLSTSVGGVTVLANGQCSIDSSNTTTGISIGTKTTNVPIFIGKTGNQVTCNSDITFTGNLTYATNSTLPVETQQLLVQDRSIVINSTPFFSGDAALLLQRFQSTPSGISDDVVTDTPFGTGTAQSGTTSTIVLAANSSAVASFYVGFYVMITAGTGRGFVTRIIAYNATNQTASVSPSFTTAPDNTSVYALYGNVFAGLSYRSITKRFELLYSATNYETSSTVVMPTAWAPLYLQNLQTVPGTGTIQTDTITGSSGTAVNVSGVVANNSALSNVSTINGDLPPTISTLSLTVANGTSTTVVIPGLTASRVGSFFIMINSDQNSNPGGPSEIWSVCKSTPSRPGSCAKLQSQSGSTRNEVLSIRWPASASANLTYDLSILTGTLLPAAGTYKFIVKITQTISSV